jgi:DNA-binding MarR family transcriptional regulator
MKHPKRSKFYASTEHSMPLPGKLFHLMSNIGKLLEDQTRIVLNDLDINHGQSRMLSALYRRSSLNQMELAEMLHLSRSGVTSLLQRMEKLHLISRCRTIDDDMRTIHVKLTPNGKKAAQKVHDVWMETEMHLQAKLTDSEVIQMQKLLLKIRNHLMKENKK